MGADQAVDDGEAESRAPARRTAARTVRAVEALEDPLLFLGRQTRARVLDLDDGLVLRRADADADADGAAGRGVVQRVADQVGDDLPQSCLVRGPARAGTRLEKSPWAMAAAVSSMRVSGRSPERTGSRPAGRVCREGLPRVAPGMRNGDLESVEGAGFGGRSRGPASDGVAALSQSDIAASGEFLGVS
ncbi:hypothetical protein SYYSPA8_14410 [Streptomyces yaizuensis]|uniref:Uncharacterized protein n=1 Tax=Streptomyces yaizuensis TaxID=2989713 RepID=A0ABQ5NYS2_9ACTN|nr:hypothetical protein SYYSPA8_14410 [Streptomyces sp. YSPA8]